MKLSNESRVEKLEKGLKIGKELSHHDKLIIDYRLTQIEFGFDVDGDGAMEIMQWRDKLGKIRWDKLMREIKQNNRLAKDMKADNPAYWQRLANHE